MEKQDQKRIYELWWKYLQQSEGYKQWLETFAKKYDDSKAWWETHLDAKDEEKKNHVLKSRRFDPQWTTLYDLIGNVHKVPFEEWWKRQKTRMDSTTPIDDYVNWIGHEIHHCWINMKGKPSDPEEFEKRFRMEFVERMKKSQYLYIIVNPDGDRKTLKAGFLEMVNQKRKENKALYRMMRQYRDPIGGKIHIDDLEKYLKVFVLHECDKKGWKEIMQLVSKYNPSSPNASDYVVSRRIHKRYLEKAKTIIRNAEKGDFPGDY